MTKTVYPKIIKLLGTAIGWLKIRAAVQGNINGNIPVNCVAETPTATIPKVATIDGI